MKQKTALMYINKRKKLLIEQRKLMMERLTINKHLRQVNKELNGVDILILHEE